ncbi:MULTISPECIES: hypothetical protein [unclassified Prochlorococcus]|uniref:hypothetical protein n=1 Tax=unclassified Prochlorococcus TaxID=2627481 RepID=UPI000533853C|nr:MULTISPECIES: hypothetical protein [unclassified Prochlorococcus]KGG16249.1 hypothetical protein EV07_1417 [Prochlorococcus sp. MIT 0603]KGG18017.1 hypothetical protein EV06_0143 [Prochlorococcus sp. MIT 0602]
MLFINKKDTGFVSLFIVLLKDASKIAMIKADISGDSGIKNERSMRLGIASIAFQLREYSD